ncbi:MAG: carboxypeptidase-like regulatory domain-containing protein [Bacteroidetes bacterium]|nr:carboxypeptidase-like regulatory domain-containing protein [Bacteroidota bacterium]
MKTQIITFIAILITSITIAGNSNSIKEKDHTQLISGKVVDKISREEIAGAEIKIDNKIIYTDLNGNFIANVNLSKTEAFVTFVSYNDAKVNIEPFSYTAIVIELESK